MFSASDKFARVTRLIDVIARQLSPCANQIYRELLRIKAAGTPIEFEFAAFQVNQPYSDKWLRHALNELIELELVQVIRKFGAGVYRLIAFLPKEENQSIGTMLPEIRQSTSEKLPSNADSFDPLYRYIEKTTNNPTHHPVNTNEQERIKITPPILKSERSQLPQPQATQTNPETEPADNNPKQPQTIEISPEISEKIKIAGFKLNTTLATIVRTTTAQIVLEAIAAAQQYLTNLQHRNKPLRRQPEAVLAKAIQEQWQPQRGESGTNVMPPDFDEWFQLARSVDIAQASSIQADLTQHQPGVLCVLTPSGWEPFDLVRAAYSLKYLQTLKNDREKMLRSEKR
jgi:hypothetical protein